MGQLDILLFLKENCERWYKIRELAKALGVSERNIRRAVVKLEAGNLIKGRCRGNYRNWNREYSISEDE